MSTIVVSVVLLTVIGLVAGILLSYASKIFAVKENQLFIDLRAELPGANCGGCGFAGCDDYAHAMADNKDVPCSKCVVGGPAVAEKLAKVLGTSAESEEKMVAFVACNGTKENAKPLYEYEGIDSCKAAKTLFGGSKACKFACIGLGNCAKACKFDAMHIVDGVAKVDRYNCVGCGACVDACPKSIVKLIPESQKIMPACRNMDKGAQVMKICKVGCIGCMKCQRECPADAITVVNNLAQVDVSKCIQCGHCADICPRHIITYFGR